MNNNDSIRISVGGDTVFVNKDDFKVDNSESKNKQRRRKRGPRNPQPKEWLASNLSQMKIADYKPFNFVDGEGIRCSLYVSGCMFACPGCYNKAAQNFNYGTPYTQELEDQIIKDLGESYCQGLTLLGGEPFLNTQVCLKLVKLELLSNLDILVDGRFEQDLMDLTLQFRGSSNQRIIDVQRSLKEGQVVIWDKLTK